MAWPRRPPPLSTAAPLTSTPARSPRFATPATTRFEKSAAMAPSAHTDTVFLTDALIGELVGFHEVDHDIWSIEFGPVELGRYDARRHRLHTGGATGPTRFNEETRNEQ